MNNKIGVFSVTLNRLYYAYHCFKSLKEKAGVSFEHIVIDNGSKDGTFEWLKEEGFNVIRNEKNKGITFASMQGYLWLLKKEVDIIIKIDSDCEILTPNLLLSIDKFFSNNIEKYVVSPTVKGIVNVPGTITEEIVNDFKINRTEHTGGIFRAMRIEEFTKVTKKCELLNDKMLNDFFRKNEFKIGYLPELEINHYETTDGQAKRYPEYFNKKYIY